MNAVVSRIAIAAVATALTATGSLAQQYPSKPVIIISPAPPGGSTEIVSRLVQPGLQEALKQPVIVESKGGAGGYIGSTYVAKAKPDGHTILLGGAFTTITATLQKSPHYSPRKDLVPIAVITSVPNMLVGGPRLKANTVAELVKEAKANPGRMNIGSNGVGTTLHLSGELFKLRTGTDIVHVPYKGWAECVTGVLSGDVDMMFDNLSTALPRVTSGKLKPLAVAAAKRHRSLPDVPTLGELGIKNAEVVSWFGLMVPAGTPQPIIETIGQILKGVTDKPEFQAQVSKQGMDVSYMAPAEAKKFWLSEIEKWESVIKAAGIIGQ